MLCLRLCAFDAPAGPLDRPLTTNASNGIGFLSGIGRMASEVAIGSQVARLSGMFRLYLVLHEGLATTGIRCRNASTSSSIYIPTPRN